MLLLNWLNVQDLIFLCATTCNKCQLRIFVFEEANHMVL